MTMQTVVSRRGQTVVPASIRAKYNIKDGDQLVWIDDGTVIRVIPVPADPIKALRGSGKGQNLTAKLLRERRKERAREGRYGK
jgi:AbrB family looped-hinge helix DNA binding protein